MFADCGSRVDSSSVDADSDRNPASEACVIEFTLRIRCSKPAAAATVVWNEVRTAAIAVSATKAPAAAALKELPTRRFDESTCAPNAPT